MFFSWKLGGKSNAFLVRKKAQQVIIFGDCHMPFKTQLFMSLIMLGLLVKTQEKAWKKTGL